MNIHHFGIIVKNINKNIAIYEKLGYRKTTETITDIIQNNNIVFMQNENEPCLIELIEPLNENSSISNFKEGYHHMCYEIESDSNFVEEFKKMKIGKIFTKPIIAPAIDNRKVMFACLNNGMFIEFLMGEKSHG